ncbi:hypothetical protein FGO68_gene11391 [Halteria grandinella]|uniref:Uncharacterized protein n=1 Tax=Halteria grandinella TaxID=5974 RepID=A0A8J8P4X2_HALGN|nr:hypothetical protein FGO68_gene11391 [Halteria grandinella]
MKPIVRKSSLKIQKLSVITYNDAHVSSRMIVFQSTICFHSSLVEYSLSKIYFSGMLIRSIERKQINYQ